MQIAMIQALCELAEKNSRLMYVLGDSGCEYDRFYREAFPRQMVDLGIAEQHAVSFAAGMAADGWMPFVELPAPFLAYRAFEAVRVDVCLQRRNVKLIGLGSGLSNSALGATHHGTEDIAVMRSLPGLTILSVATAEQVRQAIAEAYAIDGPVYLRFEMKSSGELSAPIVEHSGLQTLCEGRDGVMFATGGVVFEALEAARQLALQGLSIGVINVRRLAPFDEAGCRALCGNTRHVFTLEEHSVRGGLGSILCEVLSGLTASVTRIGLEGFAQGYGTSAELRRQNGLDAVSVARRINEEMRRIE